MSHTWTFRLYVAFGFIGFSLGVLGATLLSL